MVPNLSQLNPIHNFSPYFFTIRCNAAVLPVPGSSPGVIQVRICVPFPSLLCMQHSPTQTHPPFVNHPTDMLLSLSHQRPLLTLLFQCNIVGVFFFCAMTNKCTIISQIITPLHVSTLSCHPQTDCNQYLAKLHKYFKCSCG